MEYILEISNGKIVNVTKVKTSLVVLVAIVLSIIQFLYLILLLELSRNILIIIPVILSGIILIISYESSKRIR